MELYNAVVGQSGGPTSAINATLVGVIKGAAEAKAEGKLMSEAMAKIVETAFSDNNKKSFQALKYLVERNTKSTDKPGRGRPKKEKEAVPSDDKLLLDAIKRMQE